LKVLAWIYSGCKGGRLVEDRKPPNVGNEGPPKAVPLD
jgi:hypothetical protein